MKYHFIEGLKTLTHITTLLNFDSKYIIGFIHMTYLPTSLSSFGYLKDLMVVFSNTSYL